MKKNIKIIILVLCLTFFTACTPEYNLDIKNGKVNETLIIGNVEDKYNASSFNNYYAILDEQKMYKQTFNNHTATYNYEYSFSKYNESNMVKSCYESFHLIEENDYYVLQTGLKFDCLSIQLGDYYSVGYDKLKVNIKVVDYEVLENNADSINGNTYSWIIDKTNYTNKPIILRFKENKKIIKKEEKKSKDNSNIYIFISIIIGMIIIGMIIGIYVLSLNKKHNKI